MKRTLLATFLMAPVVAMAATPSVVMQVSPDRIFGVNSKLTVDWKTANVDVLRSTYTNVTLLVTATQSGVTKTLESVTLPSSSADVAIGERVYDMPALPSPYEQQVLTVNVTITGTDPVTNTSKSYSASAKSQYWTNNPAAGTTQYVYNRPVFTPLASDAPMKANVEYPQLMIVSKPDATKFPKPAAGYPTILFIHGGGFSLGDYNDYTSAMKKASDMGYVAASINYRLVNQEYSNSDSYKFPRWPFPAQVEDARCAVKFLKSKSTDLQINPGKIAAWGWSAGAHAATMLGMAGSNTNLDGHCSVQTTYDAKVAAVIAHAPPVDNYARVSSSNSASSVSGDIKRYWGIPVYESGPKTTAPPYDRTVSESLVQSLNGGADPYYYDGTQSVPILHLQPTDDTVYVPLNTVTRFRSKMQQESSKYRFSAYYNAGHGLDMGLRVYGALGYYTTFFHNRVKDHVFATSMKFIDQHLKGLPENKDLTCKLWALNATIPPVPVEQSMVCCSYTDDANPGDDYKAKYPACAAYM